MDGQHVEGGETIPARRFEQCLCLLLIEGSNLFENYLRGLDGFAGVARDQTAYALYAGDPANGSATRVASFREGRVGYRLWALSTGRISPSVEDRYEHDVDEMMA